MSNLLLLEKPESGVYESGKWLGIFQVDKFLSAKEEDLERVVEHHDADLRRHESRAIKNSEVNGYLKWLEENVLPKNQPWSLRPKSKLISTPDETLRFRQLLLYGGVSCLWECLIGNGTASASQSLTYFNNAQAAIGVGDSTTPAVATQTDLQASSNKLRVAMVATYPQHTDGVVASANTCTWQSSFGSGQANYAWNEMGVFNSATLATGRMLNRLVQSLGVKASGGTWVISAQISIT